MGSILSFGGRPNLDVDRVGLSGRSTALRVEVADESSLAAYRGIRRDVFCAEQGLFSGDDADELDSDPATGCLVALAPDGRVLGGVRVAPRPGDPTGAWWTGSRLAVVSGQRRGAQIGATLVRAACAYVVAAGALRFDAVVQVAAERFFARLGWETVALTELAGRPHVAMRYPIDRFERQVAATKAPLGGLLAGLHLGGAGFVGDDGAPVPGSDLVAASDAIIPSMVERDPEWAGWCSVLVNINDLAAMGAHPVALLDTVGGPRESVVRAVLTGLRRAAEAYAVPVIGGHTQIGVPPALSVTALGRADVPVPAGGGRPGHVVRLTADQAGRWRPGYTGAQWDSTSYRSPEDLATLIAGVAQTRPAAAKDVSMAGLVGTLAMLAEASGCGGEIDVADVPRPAGAGLGDWMSCFPGFAMLTAAPLAQDRAPTLPAGAVSARCGRLVEGRGVRLIWPDDQATVAVAGGATGLGAAAPTSPLVS